MGNNISTGRPELSSLTTLNGNGKRWIVFGIALNHVVVPAIRAILEQEILAEYNNLKSNHGIDVQTSHSFPAPKYPPGNVMNYENINGNDTQLKPPLYRRYDYSKFDYNVKSHVDFAKLFLQNHMAKFNAFDDTCDASAVLNLLGRVPIFSAALQNAANVVKEGRNAWGHCNFTDWSQLSFTKRFGEMKDLVQEIGLSPVDGRKILTDLNDWEAKGVVLCMNATIDADLVNTVQQHVRQLSSDLDNWTFECQEEMGNLKLILENIQLCSQKVEQRITTVEEKHDILQQEQSSTSAKLDVVEQRVTKLEDQKYPGIPQDSSYYFSTCKADMDYYVNRYDPDTRQWLFSDFDAWFDNPEDSRAYVLLGDAAVGKSVMAAVLAQRAKNDGNLAAVYFCRHYDGTRRDPRYLLGTVAYQICNCDTDYNKIVGGETGIQRMLGNSDLGVHELFTTLLEEPSSNCPPSARKLVVIDALDEAEYWSRDDFLDLIMNRFPRLPNWLLFFITSRPEDTVQSRLKTYNPCVRICAGNSENIEFYQQHELDIQRFLENRVNFSKLRQCSPKEIAKKCNGMFLYAFYIVEILNNPTLNQDIFPESINDYFRENFKRIYDIVGRDIYKKLFGCVLMAPSPLPISFISFLLRREGCVLDEQGVIDAVSQFVRTTDQTFTFLHSIIPAWLTDDKKSSRRLCIDEHEADAQFTDIILVFLNQFLEDARDQPSFSIPDFVKYILGIPFLRDNEKKLSFDKSDSTDYILNAGFRFLCRSSENSEAIFNCFTNYRFLQQRIRSKKFGIYTLIEDLELSILTLTFNEREKLILNDLCSVLKQDRQVIAGSPELLHSCLYHASEETREKVMGKRMLGPWLEPSINYIPFLPVGKLCDIDCCAFSHDKKLLAAGQGKSIFIFDAPTFQKLFGPIEVFDSGKLLHLEFSPDDKFVFFGRLDKWFSVLEGRVVEITQFLGNSECYKWGSFIYEGSYIAIIKDDTELVHLDILAYVWRECWLHEIFGEQYKSQCLSFGSEVIEPKTCQNLPCKLCSSYLDCKGTELLFHDRIVDLYAEIFRYQIWNVKTGRPVIEEMFRTQLSPFFYIWHIFFEIQRTEYHDIFWLTRSGFHAFSSILDIASSSSLKTWQVFCRKYLFMCNPQVSYEYFRHLATNAPAQCCNYHDQHVYSQDGMWLAKKQGSNIELFKKTSTGWCCVKCQEDRFTDTENYCFTNDSTLFVYLTREPNPDMYAFSLQTSYILESISGPRPVSYTTKEGKRFGYIFCDAEKRNVMVSLGDLSGKFLPVCLRCNTSKFNPIDAIFTSTHTISFLFPDGLFMSGKIDHGNLVLDAKMVKLGYSYKISVKTCVFSHDGKLVAINHSCKIQLFSVEGKFLSLVHKFTEEGERTASCLTFSPDDSFLLFCIEKSGEDQSFYIWDVKNKGLSNLVNLPLKTLIDHCCFAQNNSKIFFCNASTVQILPYPPESTPFPTVFIPKEHYTAFPKCNHCAVSSDNKLLVCCIDNEILIHEIVDGSNAFWKVPHNHSGRVEFCKFLKGNRYLMSYGIDGVVFLFDLLVWKSVAYARQESAVNIAVSPDENKVVCFRSSREVSVINLQKLKYGLPSKFQLPSSFRLPDKYNEPEERQVISPPIQVGMEYKNVEKEYLLDENDFMLHFSSESSDEDDQLVINDVDK